jgi:hypothetical protein
LAVLKVTYFNPRLGLRVVKRGFCWPAFLFGDWWAVAKGLWFPVFTFLAPIDAALTFLLFYAQGHGLGELVLVNWIVWFAYRFVVGRYGNAWLESSLKRRGYQLDATLESPVEAQRQEPTW